eukprot:1065125-Pyramimonas_sp.AAC.1
MVPIGPRTISERSERVPKRFQQGCPTELKPSLEQRFCIIFFVFIQGFRVRRPSRAQPARNELQSQVPPGTRTTSQGTKRVPKRLQQGCPTEL